MLLPVWVAAFRFVGRPYRFVVNGRTGEVQGERPWSFWKIAGPIVTGPRRAGDRGAGHVAGCRRCSNDLRGIRYY